MLFHSFCNSTLVSASCLVANLVLLCSVCVWSFGCEEWEVAFRIQGIELNMWWHIMNHMFWFAVSSRRGRTQLYKKYFFNFVSIRIYMYKYMYIYYNWLLSWLLRGIVLICALIATRVDSSLKDARGYPALACSRTTALVPKLDPSSCDVGLFEDAASQAEVVA